MKRTPTYYLVRTGVRLAFWAGVSVLVVLGGSWLAERAYGDDRPECLVDLARDFTWAMSEPSHVQLDDCQGPTGVTLLPGGRWEWSE